MPPFQGRSLLPQRWHEGKPWGLPSARCTTGCL